MATSRPLRANSILQRKIRTRLRRVESGPDPPADLRVAHLKYVYLEEVVVPGDSESSKKWKLD